MCAGDVEVLPAWWSAGNQTVYDPAAVERRRLVPRHKRYVTLWYVRYCTRQETQNPDPGFNNFLTLASIIS